MGNLGKLCGKCNEFKLFKFYSKDKTHYDGLRSNCKNCISFYMKNRGKTEKYKQKRRERYWKNREKELQNHKKSRLKNKNKWAISKKNKHKNNPANNIFQCAKSRAKIKNLEFKLTKEDIVVPKICPVLGIELKVGDGKVIDNSPTLDRIDNNKGYIKDNIIIVSKKANTIKNNATIEEIEKVYHFYKELKYGKIL